MDKVNISYLYSLVSNNPRRSRCKESKSVFFEGCLPDLIEDERCIVRNERVRAQKDPLKIDERVCALTFETKLNLAINNGRILYLFALYT